MGNLLLHDEDAGREERRRVRVRWDMKAPWSLSFLLSAPLPPPRL